MRIVETTVSKIVGLSITKIRIIIFSFHFQESRITDYHLKSTNSEGSWGITLLGRIILSAKIF